jgi:putative DNA methylase
MLGRRRGGVIERDFDVPFIADLALREKQIQQNYRPVIAVHKWFARRPGTLFRGILLSEFAPGRLRDAFYKSHSLEGRKLCDPFMGGGTPLLEANRLGCDVVGFDINPMAYWIVSEEIEHIDLTQYARAAARLRTELEKKVGRLYRTRCLGCGSNAASVKYFLWVKLHKCPECGRDVDLFPGYLVAEDARHPRNVFVCGECGELSECEDRRAPGHCHSCGASISLLGAAKRNQCRCKDCGATVRYPEARLGPPRHRMFAIEYYCPACKPTQLGRFFKKPDERDLTKAAEAETLLGTLETTFLPTEAIPAGDETNRLHRWGYNFYSQMFNARQLAGLQLSCELIAAEPSERLRHALATNLSDLLRYQNMLCRYDTMALKSLDIFSVHGFPVGLVQCESNLLGIPNGNETNVGSGGWANIVDKYAKAKAYCDRPFEVRQEQGRKVRVHMQDEWIGESRNGLFPAESRQVDLRCEDAAQALIEPESLDAVLTDPPYLGNVQYAELMDFCYVWLRRLTRGGKGCFGQLSTRNAAELTANESMNRGLDHFTDGLSRVFRRMAAAMKNGAPLAFTYHHNSLEAYYPIAVAILDSRLSCTAALPCPAEMGASIHINGTGSSIVDTVFVCRKAPCWAADDGDFDSAPSRVDADREALLRGGVKVSVGDLRCICHGHLTRIAIQRLGAGWDIGLPVVRKLQRVADLLHTAKWLLPIEKHLRGQPENSPTAKEQRT